MNEQIFVSVDWGTSNFRARLVDRASRKCIDEISSAVGGARNLYELWQTRGGKRETYFLHFLADQLRKFNAPLPINATVVISGMASSNIGLRELPYAMVPFPADGSSVITEAIPAGENFGFEILLISGIRTQNDVTRGEETQFMGCLSDEGKIARGTFIFPGTHSKHFFIRDNSIRDFKTYMTGEFFELLSRHSLLRSSVAAHANTGKKGAVGAFDEGVQLSANTNLLHTAFLVRTNALFRKLTPADNFRFLSGLIIGCELRELLHEDSGTIYLVGDNGLIPSYESALGLLGLGAKVLVMDIDRVKNATIHGQSKVLQLKNLKQ